MNKVIPLTLVAAILGLPVLAQDAGDPVAGEGEFRKCRACHMIQDDTGTDIVKGGATGPNLWNIVGSKVANEADYRYSDGLLAAAEINPELVWSEAELIAYVTDPTAWAKEKSGDDSARSKMTFKLNRNQADLVAYLATVSPSAPAQ